MKYTNIREVYPLTGRTVDTVSENIDTFLKYLNLERSNRLRIRLSMEEALLRLRERFGEETDVSVFIGIRFGRPSISFEVLGDSFDPLANSEDELGEWSESLLYSIGLIPHYTYQNGVNVVQLKLVRPRINPVFTLIASIVLGIILGVAGLYLLSDSVRADIIEVILNPIESAFTHILNASSGPIIFFSIMGAICGVGNIATMKTSGKRLLFRFIVISFSVSVLCSVLSVFVFNVMPQNIGSEKFSSILDFIVQAVPNDILSPFIQGDSPQIILVALVMATALLSLGNRASGLVRIVEQLDLVGITIADWVSRISPFFITILLVFGIWRGSFNIFSDLWKPILVFTGACIVMLLTYIFWISLKEKVRIGTLVSKMHESFLIALRNASVDAAFGSNQVCCEKRLGISKNLTGYGIPLGLVTFMPASICATTIFTFYAASVSGVTVNFVWYFIAVVLTVMLLVATPPVTGIGLMTYTVIFSRLGIASELLIVALVADILFGFLASAVNQALLQVELVAEAGRTNLLDRDILLKEHGGESDA